MPRCWACAWCPTSVPARSASSSLTCLVQSNSRRTVLSFPYRRLIHKELTLDRISAFVFLGFGYEGLLLWFIGTFAYCFKDLVVTKKRTIGVLFLLPIAEFYYKQTWWKGGLLIPSLPTPSKSFIHIVYAILIAYILCCIVTFDYAIWLCF